MEHLLLSCIESRIENNQSLYSCFQLGPFDKGQGLTVANAMRRTLLSELSGLAIICVEIQGISHEYSSIKGVRESVLDILLNLKQIVFISNGSYTSPEVGFLKIQGPAIIKAGDLKLPTHVQCVDPNQYIATLANNACLEMKFMICKGKNFVIQTSFALISKTFHSHFSNKQKNNIRLVIQQDSKQALMQHVRNTNQSITRQAAKKFKITPVLDRQATWKRSETDIFNKGFFKKIEEKLLYSIFQISEFQVFQNIVYKENLKKKSVTNILFVDSVFMPVVKVNFSIKNINKFYKIKSSTLVNKFQKSISQEKIFLEVWTNGSIDPKNAVYLAARQIIDIFVPLQKTYLAKKKKSTLDLDALDFTHFNDRKIVRDDLTL